jgi:leucyl-tRNA synthetase
VPKAGGVVSEKVDRALNHLIKKITEDIENFRFNTAISAFMEFHNQVKDEPISIPSLKTFLTLLYPFAPHIAEELNQALGGKRSLQLEKWPEYDSSKIVSETLEVVVQVNGKVRGKVTVPANADEAQVKAEVQKLEAVQKALVNESVKRVVYVKGRLINLVI